jgi:bifunctional UDP-N-acetylglucosamine pyrophosphorylase/glucosamine-1-phosphate N-acetyltransferase
MKTASAIGADRIVVVTGHGSAAVTSTVQAWEPDALTVQQTEQLGTAHAVQQARSALEGVTGDVFVLYGDTPFIRAETLDAMRAARRDHAVVVLGFEARDPGRYGRLKMTDDRLEAIVEFKDASPEERAITLCNSGVICAEAETLFSLIDAVGNDNASGEYYLTDIIAIANARGLTATAVVCDEAETMGVNSRAQLADAEAAFQTRARAEALENGVTLTAPDTVFFAHDTVVGRDSIIEPNVIFGPDVTIESGVRIRAFSHLEGCHVSRGATVGPFARLRPGAELAEDVHVGNFCEIKNATIDEGAKVNHLSYIGDASVGARTNIGAGTITCNYDGVFKHRTTIGREAFIGSNTMLVAPVTVGDRALTGSGSVVTQDIPADALSIARAKQVNKPGLGKRLMDSLRTRKSAKKEQ